MAASNLDVVQDFLEHAFDPDALEDAVARLVADDATYVSLNFDDPELHRIMDHAGTKHGATAFVENFRNVRKIWENDSFEVLDTLEQDDKVAVFGRFTLRSVTLDRSSDSPFVVLAKLKDGRITYFQYMEDTFATAMTFWEGGAWTVRAEPGLPDPIHVPAAG